MLALRMVGNGIMFNRLIRNPRGNVGMWVMRGSMGSGGIKG